MLKIFFANCKSNWKKNLTSNLSLFLPISVYWRNAAELMSGDEIFLSALFIILFLLPLMDISVPDMLYLCPVSLQDRKEYIRRVSRLRKYTGIGFCAVIAVILYLNQVISGYMLFIYLVFTTLLFHLCNLYIPIPGNGNLNQIASGQRIRLIERRDLVFMCIYIIGIALMLMLNYEKKLHFSFLCVIQWIVMITGAFFVRYFYKKYYEDILTLAADYETCMKYRQPVKK